MTDPEISVIIPVWNAMPYVTRAVTSVIEQSIGVDRMEILAIDDGSTDGSGEELDRLAASCSALRVIHTEPSGGASRPRNVGLDHATGRFVFFLDADDSLAPEALERMLAYAEEHGSDVVLGRIQGTGGHHTPTTMFTHDDPRVDLFNSNIYRSLNVFKLMRRDLIERLGVRFPEEMGCAEDQPFMAAVYLNAEVISVLASYTCIYWHLREDGQNKSILRRDLVGRMRAPDIMFPIVVANTEPGPGRDRLMSRHFGAEVIVALEAILLESSREEQQAAFARVQAWLEEYYTDGIDAQLSAFHHVCFALVEKGMLDEALEMVRLRLSGEEPDVLVEDGRVFMEYPSFRDAGVGVPDERFEETHRVGVNRTLDSATWNGDVFELEGHACLSMVGCATPAIALILRERASGDEYLVAAQTAPCDGSGDCAGGCFSAAIDPRLAADGELLPSGLWDVSVHVADHGIERERRLGGRRSEEFDEAVRARLVSAPDGRAAIVRPYYTESFGNLTLAVSTDQNALGGIVRIDDVRWSSAGPAALVVRGNVPAVDVPTGALTLVARQEGGPEHTAMCVVAAEGALAARLELGRAAAGHALEAGTYALELRLAVADLAEAWPIPRPKSLKTLRWWRGALPYHAKPGGAASGPLKLTISRVQLVRAIKRRLSG